MLFSDIIGLDDIKQMLIQAVKSEHIAHAQLFAGAEGYGHLALALAYAQYVNCTNKQEDDACGKCPSCMQYNKLVHPDLHFIFPTATTKKVTSPEDAVSQVFLPEWREFLTKNPYSSLPDWAIFFGAENKLCNISRNESRNIVKALSMKAFMAKYKVMIIWLPELMRTEASNAILKILEEPPQKTLFLLVTNAREQILPTILSRSQVVNVRPFTDDEITQALVQNFEIPQAQAQNAAFLAEGNLNEALKIAQNVDDVYTDFFKSWMRFCFKTDYQELANLMEQFAEKGKEAQKNILLYSLKIVRESMLAKFGGESLLRLPDETLEFVRNFSKVLSENAIEKTITLLNDALHHIERNANPKMLFLNLSVNIAILLR